MDGKLLDSQLKSGRTWWMAQLMTHMEHGDRSEIPPIPEGYDTKDLDSLEARILRGLNGGK